MQGIWDELSDYATRWHDFWEIIESLFSFGAAAFRDIFSASAPAPIEVTSFPTTNWDRATAIGTILAALVALGLGLYERRSRRARQEEERARLTEERDEARRSRDEAEKADATRQAEAQARSVAIWAEDDPGYAPELPRTLIAIGNFSPAPIFDLFVEFEAHYGKMDFKAIRSLQPGATTILNQTHCSVGLQPPPSPGVPAYPDIVDSCTVTFRDIAGRTWRRDNDGGLEPLKTPAHRY